MLNLDVCHARVNSRNFGFIQTHENNTKSPCPKQKRNMTPLFWVDLTFEWYEDHMVLRVYYYFCLEPTVTKDTWIRTTSITVMVIFFESGFLKATWSQLHSNSPLNSHKAHWQQYFERYPTILYFMDMDQHAYYIFHQDCGKRDWNENRWKCLEKGKFHKNPSVHLEEHCTKGKSLFHLFYALLFLWNLVFKFNIVLIGLGG